MTYTAPSGVTVTVPTAPAPEKLHDRFIVAHLSWSYFQWAKKIMAAL